jgi:hypothetical protein
MTQETDARNRRIQKGIAALKERYGEERFRKMATSGDTEMHARNIISNDTCFVDLQRALKPFADRFQAVCDMLRTHAHEVSSSAGEEAVSV